MCSSDNHNTNYGFKKWLKICRLSCVKYYDWLMWICSFYGFSINNLENTDKCSHFDMCTTCMMASCIWSSDEKKCKKTENSPLVKVGQNIFSCRFIYIVNMVDVWKRICVICLSVRLPFCHLNSFFCDCQKIFWHCNV